MATKRSPGREGEVQDLRQVREHLVRLSAIMERQEARIEQQQQQIEQQREQAHQQQARIDELSNQARAQPERVTPSRGRGSWAGRGTSRRRLLAGAGAAAAAATVALVASEGQEARAAPAPDGSSLMLGSGATNTESTTTTLSVVSSTNPTPVFVVDATNSTAASPVAIQGTSNVANGIGLYGTSSGNGSGGGSGIVGSSTYSGSGTTGPGVAGTGVSGAGVIGTSTSSAGVWGNSTSYYGVLGNSTSYIDVVAAGTGRFRQYLQASAGAPTSGGPYKKGEQIRDSNGDLFLCVADGSPGTWKQVFAAGSTISTASGTTLSAAASSSPATLFTVDASNSTYASAGPIAILGTANPSGTNAFNAYGVYGYANKGYAVYGQSDTGRGVSGFANSGVAVLGTANGPGGTAVAAYSTSGLDVLAGGTGRVRQVLQSFAGAPTSGTYFAGEMIRDSNGDLWLCTVGDGTTVGTWVKVAHLAPGATSGGAITYLSKPIRLLDTRSGATDALTNGGGPYTVGGSPYPVTIAGVSFNGVTVPSSCAGAIGNVTVVATASGGGYLALVPHGAGFSGTANLAYSANQIVSNAFNVGLSGGKLDIIIGGNPTDVILDLFAVVA